MYIKICPYAINYQHKVAIVAQNSEMKVIILPSFFFFFFHSLWVQSKVGGPGNCWRPIYSSATLDLSTRLAAHMKIVSCKWLVPADIPLRVSKWPQPKSMSSGIRVPVVSLFAQLCRICTVGLNLSATLRRTGVVEQTCCQSQMPPWSPAEVQLQNC